MLTRQISDTAVSIAVLKSGVRCARLAVLCSMTCIPELQREIVRYVGSRGYGHHHHYASYRQSVCRSRQMFEDLPDRFACR